MSNILALPLVSMTVETGDQEDWLDGWQYVASDGVTPIALTGISFEMEVRHLDTDNDVVLSASTTDGRLLITGTDNSFLLINIPVTLMNDVPVNTYVADIVGVADGFTRVCARIEPLTIIRGITR